MAITLNLSIDVPSTAELNDFVYGLGYEDTINGSPNPVTKAQYAKKAIISYIRGVIRSKRANDAAEAASNAKNAEVDALVIV